MTQVFSKRWADTYYEWVFEEGWWCHCKWELIDIQRCHGVVYEEWMWTYTGRNVQH